MKKKETPFQVFCKDFSKDKPFHNDFGYTDTWTVRPTHIAKLNQIFKSKPNKHEQIRKRN